jgi:HD superfamily phosphohydrolase
MTGTGAGAIDFDWLVENVRVAEIEIDAPDDSDAQARRVPTFCLHKKALPAAEQFLLARYTLHQQVYFHKATRCVEHMIAKLLRAVAKAASGKKADLKRTGLPDGHPLLRFFARGGDTVTNYLALDDTLVFSALESMSFAEDGVIADTAMRLRERKLYKTLDLAEFGENAGVQRSRLRRIQKQFEAKLASEDVLLDEKATVGIYAEIGGDEERMHKKLHILDGVDPREISELSPMIEALVMKKKQFTRLYFREVSDRDDARG